MKRLILALVLMTIWAVDSWGFQSDGWQFCDKTRASRDEFKSFFAEAPVNIGQTTDGKVIEVFRTKDGQNWTILLHYPNGVTCAIASGTDWIDIKWVDPAGRSS